MANLCLQCACRASSSRIFCSSLKTYLLPLRKTNATIPFYIKIPHRCQFSRQYGIRTKAETSIINRIKGFLNLNRRDTWNDFKNIVKIAWPHKRRIFVGLCFLCVGSTIFLLMPRILGKLMDSESEINGPSKEDFSYKLAIYFKDNPIFLIAMVLTGSFSIFARIYFMHTAAQLVINDLRIKIFSSVIKQDIAFFDRNKVGEIVSRLSSDAYIVGNSISSNLGNGLRCIIQFIGSASLMFYTSSKLCFLGVYIIPFIAGPIFIYGNFQRKVTTQMQEEIARTNQLATEHLSAIKTIRQLVAENKEISEYKKRISAIWEIAKKEGLANGILYGGFQAFGYGFLISIFYYGNSLITRGLLTYGDLASFTLYSLLCAGSITGLITFYGDLMKGLGASARLFELDEIKPRIPITGGVSIRDVNEGIRFNSVAFAYPDRHSTLTNVSFTIKPGQITAIVGPSGSGKSTIAHLILRFYDPTEGQITVDGHNLRELDLRSWRKMIGTVSQEPVLFSTTIRENLLYGCYDADGQMSTVVTDEEINAAAEKANCMEFIKLLPTGLDTLVGEHGSLLSGGQKQRIAIARALITKPKILILDEATSALDAASEYLIRKALSSIFSDYKQMMLIIAHRLSTIKHANQIVVLEKGTLAELGTFDQLMAERDGVFRKLVEKQTISWRNENY